MIKGPVPERPGSSLQKNARRFKSDQGLGSVWHMHDRRDY